MCGSGHGQCQAKAGVGGGWGHEAGNWGKEGLALCISPEVYILHRCLYFVGCP